MEINVKETGIDDLVSIEPHGKITIGEGASEFRASVKENQEKNMILNFRDVSYIDSSALGELLSTYTLAQNLGREAVLTGLSDSLRDLLTTAKLLTVYKDFDSVDNAINYFRSRSD